MKLLRAILILCVIALAVSGIRYAKAQSAPKSLYLTWSNEWTWATNIVYYTTNLAQPWRVYAIVTNGYTNTPWLKLDSTNRQCYFVVKWYPE